MKNIPDWISFDGLRAKASSQPTQFPNEPIQDARIVGTIVHYYSTGVLTVKFARDNQLYETVMYLPDVYEIIDSVGIKPRGRIPASIIFVTIHKRTYPVRVGSGTYERCRVQDEVRPAKPIPKRELEVGGIYETLTGKRGVYLGSVNYLDPVDGTTHSNHIIHELVSNSMLWLEDDIIVTSPDMWEIRKDIYQWVRSSLKVWLWRPQVISFKHSHSYKRLIEKIPEIDTERLASEIRNTIFSGSDWGGSIAHTINLLTMTTGVPKLYPRYLSLLKKCKQHAVLIPRRLDELPELLTHKDSNVRRYALKQKELLESKERETLKK
jgi:hypothetical protein